MKFAPRPIQHPMIEFIHEHERCALWAGCGTGKTSGTLSALDGLYLAGETEPTLVLGPLRVARDVWSDEAQRWSNLRHIEVQPIVGTPKEREAALRNTNASVFTINYEMIPWLIEKQGGRWPYKTIVADEASRLKSFRGGFRRSPKGKLYYQGAGGQRARALGRVAHLVKRFIELTGTPSSNGLEDLWGQAWFLDAGQRLGRTFEAFSQRYFTKGRDGYSLEPLPFTQETIQDLLRDICLSINPKDWYDLKEPVVNVIQVELPSKARGIYRQMEKEMFMQIENHEIEAANAAGRTMKCLQICNGFAFTDEHAKEWADVHDVKIQALESIVEENSGAPVFVAYHFVPDLARLKEAFPDALDLSTKEGLTAAKAGKGRIWLAHPASVGHGVDGLQEHCNTAVFYSQWWDLEAHDQFIERIGPMRQMQAGKDRPVFIHYLVARRTVDELVMARRETKRSVQDLLLDYMKGKTK
jgi:SNF2 family DNA or RNA helicase